MPIARLAGNGMDFADALELHALADAGLSWPDAAERLGDRNLRRAGAASARGQRRSRKGREPRARPRATLRDP